MQRVLLKLRFHQSSLFQPHLAPQPKSTGLAGTTVSVLEAFAMSCQSGTTPLHTQNPQSHTNRKNSLLKSLLKLCTALWSLTSTAMEGIWFFLIFWPNKAMAVGPSGEAELTLHNFDMMVYHGAGNLHTAVSFITVITPFSSTRSIWVYGLNLATVSKAWNSRKQAKLEFPSHNLANRQKKNLCLYALIVARRLEVTKASE